MRKIVALFLVVSAFVALIAPECAVSLYSRSQNMNFSFTYFTSEMSLVADDSSDFDSVTADNSQQDDQSQRGDPAHVCDHCHLGHCGVIIAQVRPALMELGASHGSSSKTLVLKSFISSLFRPPIA